MTLWNIPRTRSILFFRSALGDSESTSEVENEIAKKFGNLGTKFGNEIWEFPKFQNFSAVIPFFLSSLIVTCSSLYKSLICSSLLAVEYEAIFDEVIAFLNVILVSHSWDRRASCAWVDVPHRSWSGCASSAMRAMNQSSGEVVFTPHGPVLYGPLG